MEDSIRIKDVNDIKEELPKEDINENSITVAPTISNSGTDYLKSNFDMENTYYFPNNAILSIKEM